jgi:hypothetical protein
MSSFEVIYPKKNQQFLGGISICMWMSCDSRNQNEDSKSFLFLFSFPVVASALLAL